MAIAFNLPSDDDTDARYEVLNRLLVELCDVIRTLMTAQNQQREQQQQQQQQNPSNARAGRPTSDSALPRLPDLLLHSSTTTGTPSVDDHHHHHHHHPLPRRRICSLHQTPPASPSCGVQHLSRTFSEVFDSGQSLAYFGDDEVFCSNNNNNTTSNNTILRSSLPPKQRRRRRRSSSFKEGKRKNAKAKGDDVNWNNNTIISAETTTTSPDESEGNLERVRDAPVVGGKGSGKKKPQGGEGLISTLLSTKLGGSIWTAVVLVVGWKLLATAKR